MKEKCAKSKDFIKNRISPIFKKIQILQVFLCPKVYSLKLLLYEYKIPPFDRIFHGLRIFSNKNKAIWEN